MKVGDKVRIRTGKAGRPPVGEVLALLPSPECAPIQQTTVRVKRGAAVELYPFSALTVIPDAA